MYNLIAWAVVRLYARVDRERCRRSGLTVRLFSLTIGLGLVCLPRLSVFPLSSPSRVSLVCVCVCDERSRMA